MRSQNLFPPRRKKNFVSLQNVSDYLSLNNNFEISASNSVHCVCVCGIFKCANLYKKVQNQKFCWQIDNSMGSEQTVSNNVSPITLSITHK